jgi:effector-associated domain 8 (EAD8)-containing protein
MARCCDARGNDVLRLATNDRTRLIGMLERLRELETEDGRHEALMAAGLGELVPKLDLSGSPEIALNRIVDCLLEQEALAAWIGWAKGVTGVEQHELLDKILGRAERIDGSTAVEQTSAARADFAIAIGAGIAALGGLVLVIAMFVGGGGGDPASDDTARRVPADRMLERPGAQPTLLGTVELPAEPPSSTRSLTVTSGALAGARTIVASGSTIRLFDVAPAGRAPAEFELSVAAGESLDIEYDGGHLNCFAPPSARMRVEELPLDPKIQSVDYKIGYVRSSWTGSGAARVCAGYDARASVKPNVVTVGMHVAVPAGHGVSVVSVDGSHPVPCSDLSQLRIVTMSELVPDRFIGPIVVDTSWVDRLERDRTLGVTCEALREPGTTITRTFDNKLDCELSERRFECRTR